MKLNKNELDEMQKEKRNKIGNQMFMLMFYVLFIDIGLDGMGVHWLAYPANIMVIMMVFMSIYLIRMIAANAYVPPKTQSRRNGIFLFGSILFAVVIAVIVSITLSKSGVTSVVKNANDNSAFILFIVSSVGLLISLIVTIIKNVNDKNVSDD